MKKLSEEEQTLSNRNHHLTWFKGRYKEFVDDTARDAFAVAELHKRAKEREKAIKWADVQRRENAVAMGVGIEESDLAYDYDEFLKALPALIKEMLEFEKLYKVNFADIRPYE